MSFSFVEFAMDEFAARSWSRLFWVFRFKCRSSTYATSPGGAVAARDGAYSRFELRVAGELLGFETGSGRSREGCIGLSFERFAADDFVREVVGGVRGGDGSLFSSFASLSLWCSRFVLSRGSWIGHPRWTHSM